VRPMGPGLELETSLAGRYRFGEAVVYGQGLAQSSLLPSCKGLHPRCIFALTGGTMPKARKGNVGPGVRHPSTTVGVVVYTRHYREAILRTIERAPGLVAVDFGDGGVDSLARLDREHPQLLLVDLSNRRLIAFARHTHASQSSTPIIALNRGETEPEIITLFECGLTGFVAHDASSEEILEAIRAALLGEFRCPPRIAAALVRRVNEAGEPADTPHIPPRLSPREIQIACHLEQSLTNKEIAVRLGIEAATVKNHVHNILRKLATHRRDDAVIQLRTRSPELRVVRPAPRPKDQ